MYTCFSRILYENMLYDSKHMQQLLRYILCRVILAFVQNFTAAQVRIIHSDRNISYLTMASDVYIRH